MEKITDRIEIRAFEILLYCGILPEEKTRKQPILFDIDIYIDLEEAAISQNLEKSINYGAVIAELEASLTQKKFLLLETLAKESIDMIFLHPQASEITVTAKKTRPPVPSSVGSTGVRLHRKRSK